MKRKEGKIKKHQAQFLTRDINLFFRLNKKFFKPYLS